MFYLSKSRERLIINVYIKWELPWLQAIAIAPWPSSSFQNFFTDIYYWELILNHMRMPRNCGLKRWQKYMEQSQWKVLGWRLNFYPFDVLWSGHFTVFSSQALVNTFPQWLANLLARRHYECPTFHAIILFDYQVARADELSNASKHAVKCLKKKIIGFSHFR